MNGEGEEAGIQESPDPAIQVSFWPGKKPPPPPKKNVSGKAMRYNGVIPGNRRLGNGSEEERPEIACIKNIVCFVVGEGEGVGATKTKSVLIIP